MSMKWHYFRINYSLVSVQKSGAKVYINKLGLYFICGRLFHSYNDAINSQDWT